MYVWGYLSDILDSCVDSVFDMQLFTLPLQNKDCIVGTELQSAE